MYAKTTRAESKSPLTVRLETQHRRLFGASLDFPLFGGGFPPFRIHPRLYIHGAPAVYDSLQPSNSHRCERRKAKEVVSQKASIRMPGSRLIRRGAAWILRSNALFRRGAPKMIAATSAAGRNSFYVHVAFSADGSSSIRRRPELEN